ncbi:MAG: cadherin repeat domain-containing protein [Pirellulaceae bacterium]|nr:cadherin repeat domain-containing protein [Pirellulaceae bacterium]
MTQRERNLAMVVGGLLVLLVFYWGFNKYRDAIDQRTKQITSLERQQLQLLEKQFDGARAEGQMSEYFVRSLPGNVERARSEYSKWLLNMVQANRLRGANVDPSTSIPVADLYTKHSFRVTGNAEFSSLISLLHSFYAKDYLHRIRQLDMKPNKSGGFDVELAVDAIGLTNVPNEAEQPGNQSWRVDNDLVAYSDPILNRNLFEPPNQAPRYTGSSSIQAVVGKQTPIPLTFKDPEDHRISYELIDAPEDLVSLDQRSGTLRVQSDEKRDITVKVRATDSGYPKREVEQTLVVKVVDPPPPPPVEKPAPKFDDASQTVLTGLVQGREDWTAWMNVRTRGTTLKLRVGDEFEIGSVKGKVTEITAKFVEVEVDGKRYVLKSKENLADAVKQSQED